MEKFWSEAGDVLGKDFLDPRQNIYLLTICFLFLYFVTQGAHGKLVRLETG